MRKTLALMLGLMLSVASFAADSSTGIKFFKGTWAEVVAKAKAENKLIFADFYTQWCGPCMNMAEGVFTLPTVGDFYNSNFINVKIDAEEAEGSVLAKKYGVRSYPTYAFIDPNTQENLHRSGSTQTAEVFIFTGQSALTPNMRSFYMDSEFDKGNTDREFLKGYIRYAYSVYKRDNAKAALAKLIGGGAKLSDADIWPIYVDCIQGMDTPYIQEISDNYAEFCKLFGKKAVDAKLAKETTYGDVAKIKALCDFEGKSFNVSMIEIGQLQRAQNYDALAKAIDALIADPSVNQSELCSRLKFVIRTRSITALPQAWAKKTMEYYQYIAYNSEDRRDPFIHQEYAAALESVLRSVPADQWANYLPESIVKAPVVGKKEYSMRSAGLKPKPVKGKK